DVAVDALARRGHAGLRRRTLAGRAAVHTGRDPLREQAGLRRAVAAGVEAGVGQTDAGAAARAGVARRRVEAAAVRRAGELAVAANRLADALEANERARTR